MTRYRTLDMRRLLPSLALLAACERAAPPPPAAVPVTIALADRRDVPLLLDATGTVEPMRSAAVEAQVGGLVTRVAFREGDDVREGQLLFELDQRPYRTALVQAEAALARDRARWQVARLERDRQEQLVRENFSTQAALDQARTEVAALEATLAADSAAVERARLDLQFAEVRAPISGRAGAVLLREGNVVRPVAGRPLVQINQLAPIQVRFNVPAAYLGAVRQRAGRTLPVRVTPVGDTAATRAGTLAFIDNAVDSLTGTVALKATFPNADRSLWPGALVRVELQLDVERGALVVPRSAILTGQTGSLVFVVDSAEQARVRQVTLRRSTDALAVVADGLAPGERVVIDGQLKLTNGTKVAVRNPAPGAGEGAAAADEGGA